MLSEECLSAPLCTHTDNLFYLLCSGYGHDKASHAFELAAAGYEFRVLPEVTPISFDFAACPIPEEEGNKEVDVCGQCQFDCTLCRDMALM